MEQNNELIELKLEAQELNLAFNPRIGAEKLRLKIANKRRELAELAGPGEVKTDDSVKQVIVAPKQTPAELFAERKREATRLVRVIVTCMNPNKAAWRGDIISVGSSKLGTFKKFVPFNNNAGYHIPNIMYKELLSRKCSIAYATKGPRGEKINKMKQIQEYSIQLLDPLDAKELKELARRQTMTGSIDQDEE